MCKRHRRVAGKYTPCRPRKCSKERDGVPRWVLLHHTPPHNRAGNLLKIFRVPQSNETDFARAYLPAATFPIQIRQSHKVFGSPALELLLVATSNCVNPQSHCRTKHTTSSTTDWLKPAEPYESLYKPSPWIAKIAKQLFNGSYRRQCGLQTQS
jgi:hypothetical protein